MYNEKIKEWIRENILDKNGNPQGRSFTVRQKKKVEECDIILELTSFLEKDCSIAERMYYVINDLDSRILCANKGCSEFVSFIRYKYGPNIYCSSVCAVKDDVIKEKMKVICLEKYGVENPLKSEIIKNKIKQTLLRKYGVINPFQMKEVKDKIKKKNLENLGVEYPMQSKSIQEKSKQTLLRKYGVDHSSKIPGVMEKMKKACLKKYGVENPMQSEVIKKKTRQTNMKKYGVEHASQRHIPKKNLELLHNKEWLKKQHHEKKMSLREIAKVLDMHRRNIYHYFHKFNIEVIQYNGISIPEKEIRKLFGNIMLHNNKRSAISPYELDIYVPDYNLAIEHDGLYWHSKYDKNYHINKTKLCEEKGIQLLHIFENEWLDPIKQDIWKTIISNKLGNNNKIHVNKCEIREIKDNILVKEFLKNNHLQSYILCSINLGLFYDNELVSLMIFDKTKHNNDYEWEIKVFCNKIFTDVIDGASKLFEYFINNYKPKSMFSRVDRRYDNGLLYKKLGFKLSHYTKPNCWYFECNKFILYPQSKFQKDKMKDLLELYDPNKSETENMLDNKYYSIYDCGDVIFSYFC